MNAGAGSIGAAKAREQAARVEAEFARVGVEATVHLCEGSRLATTAREAAATGADAVVSAGGDGTVNAVASALVGGDVPLGVLPLGTLNHFARDIGMPDDLPAAVRLIANGQAQRVDVGEINGRFFVNNSSIGLYPEIVSSRDQDRRQSGRSKWWAMTIAVWRVLRRFPLLLVRVVTEGKAVVTSTPFLFVGNNDYQVTPRQLGRRDRLDGGRLSLYVARSRSRRAMLWLMLRALFRRVEAVGELVVQSVTEARVDTGRKQLRVALDGEVRTMTSPLHYRIRARALPVLMAPV